MLYMLYNFSLFLNTVEVSINLYVLFPERKREKWVIICILQKTMLGLLTVIKGIFVMIKVIVVPFTFNLCIYTVKF